MRRCLWVHASILIEGLARTDSWSDFWKGAHPSLPLFHQMGLQKALQDDITNFEKEVANFSLPVFDLCRTEPSPKLQKHLREPRNILGSLDITDILGSCLLGQQQKLTRNSDLFEDFVSGPIFSPQTAVELRRSAYYSFGSMLLAAQSTPKTLQYVEMGVVLCSLYYRIFDMLLYDVFIKAIEQTRAYKLSEEALLYEFAQALDKRQWIGPLSEKINTCNEAARYRAVASHVRMGKRWKEIMEIFGKGSLLLGQNDPSDTSPLRRLDIPTVIEFGTDGQWNFLKENILRKSTWLKGICSSLVGFADLAQQFFAKSNQASADECELGGRIQTLFELQVTRTFGAACLVNDDLYSFEDFTGVGLSLAFTLLVDKGTTHPNLIYPELTRLFKTICRDVDASSERELPRCPVCMKIKAYRFCMKCKDEVYGDEEHQRRHWEIRRKTCQSSAEEESKGTDGERTDEEEDGQDKKGDDDVDVVWTICDEEDGTPLIKFHAKVALICGGTYSS